MLQIHNGTDLNGSETNEIMEAMKQNLISFVSSLFIRFCQCTSSSFYCIPASAAKIILSIINSAVRFTAGPPLNCSCPSSKRTKLQAMGDLSLSILGV